MSHPFIFLGSDIDFHYFLCRSNRSIKKIMIGSFSKVKLLELAPLSYWCMEFPRKGSFDFESAVDYIIRCSELLGTYTIPDNQRIDELLKIEHIEPEKVIEEKITYRSFEVFKGIFLTPIFNDEFQRIILTQDPIARKYINLKGLVEVEEHHLIFDSLVNFYNNLKNKNEVENYIKKLDYKDFLNTFYWILISDHVRMKYSWKCALCNSKDHTHAHHKTYEIHGKEIEFFDTEIICLCKKCHKLFHKNEDKIKKLKKENNNGN
jgi:hypothetical protein